jgi:hypothetical protein
LFSNSLFRKAWADNQPLWAITFFSMGQSRAREAPVIEAFARPAIDKSRRPAEPEGNA